MPPAPTPLRRQPRLVAYLVGEAASAVGSWALLIALWGVAAYRFGAGPGGTTLIAVSFTLPAVLLGPLAGLLVDRHGARRVLVAADVVAGLSALSLVLADSFGSVVALSLVHGAAFATFQPAVYALPPQVVADVDLARTNALLRLTTSLAIVVGPAVGGAVIAAWGFRSVFVVDAGSYVLGLAGALLLRPRARRASLRRRRPTAGRGRSHWEATAEGLALARRLPDVRRVLVLNAAVYLLYGACLVYEPLYVRDVLGRSASTFAQLQSAFGLSLLVVGVLALRMADRLADAAVLAGSVAGAGAFAGLYLGTRSVTFAFVGVVLWGGATACFGPPGSTLLQRATPARAHGRIMALDRTLDGATKLVAMLAAGAAAAVVGVRPAAVAFAGLTFLAGVAALARPTRRRSNAEEPVGSGDTSRSTGVADPAGAVR